MRILTNFALVGSVATLALASAGCRSGMISVRAMGDGGTAVPASDASIAPTGAEVFASRVEPMLGARCGACHGADRTGPDFLRPDPDVRTTLLSYPALVDLETPSSSRLLTKGEHSGPGLSAGEADAVREWIELEAAEGTMVDPVERELATTPVEIREGFNALPLDVIGLAGTTLHFVAARVGEGMFLDDVQLAAGPAGARLEHPVLVTWLEGAPSPDPVDRFAGVELVVDPNTSRPFDTGTVVLTSFPEGALLSVHFDRAEPVAGTMPEGDGGMPMPTDGCSQLEAFRTNAAPQLTTYCTSCHAGGNASATASMDMTRVAASDDATLRLGCNQVLGRISPTSPTTSGLFTQPDPTTGGGHDFKFSGGELDGFRSAILAWFEMEAP